MIDQDNGVAQASRKNLRALQGDYINNAADIIGMWAFTGDAAIFLPAAVGLPQIDGTAG
jgi:hypothetical protein